MGISKVPLTKQFLHQCFHPGSSSLRLSSPRLAFSQNYPFAKAPSRDSFLRICVTSVLLCQGYSSLSLFFTKAYIVKSFLHQGFLSQLPPRNLCRQLVAVTCNTITLRGGMVPRYSTYSSHSCPGSGSKKQFVKKKHDPRIRSGHTA